ncbi:sensor histidine kinase [Streptantibioticus silvisoli]|uniref:histidine kinase n=1 Tax=Streptantibioticus silvisoli TaxID=2705255 RepID=A0ABT6W131_9ACTN|nr:hypothetical protein [Streptantibioticus silvisoli]MDI5964452.1 hypothetical protein [Streptantibioticus silvisoli]
MHALRSDSVMDLDEELSALTAAHRTRHHTDVTLRTSTGSAALSAAGALVLLRVAQEPLANAAQHAPGRPVDPALDHDDTHVTLTVGNSRSGPAPATGFATVNGGHGRTGLRERLVLLGGALDTGTHDDRRTVTARLPR